MGIHVHENCLHMARREDGTPWWTAFPEPKSDPNRIEPAEVLNLLERHQNQEGISPRDFLLVDARRTDCKGGTVSSSLNMPAHSFYPTRQTVYELCKQAGIKRIIFYCGQSNGRGPRCAAWMQDYIDDVGGEIQSQVMTGGIRGWVATYGRRMVDSYDAKAWEEDTT
ncbi:Rhodanese-like domain-containing protein [Echria macrotheca]|uniref:Rhodanese-like domain-containing protein n=1 Tax=Echria macrotheca TaxID=438768 RepID=A0AAJ0BBB1_9PEZI|nr:Rhodanese-like domain-containing protein [Echria macrotheca]